MNQTYVYTNLTSEIMVITVKMTLSVQITNKFLDYFLLLTNYQSNRNDFFIVKE